MDCSEFLCVVTSALPAIAHLPEVKLHQPLSHFRTRVLWGNTQVSTRAISMTFCFIFMPHLSNCSVREYDRCPTMNFHHLASCFLLLENLSQYIFTVNSTKWPYNNSVNEYLSIESNWCIPGARELVPAMDLRAKCWLREGVLQPWIGLDCSPLLQHCS